MKKILITIIATLFVSATAFAQKQIIINEECVYLDQLTAASMPHNKVTCGIKPGESKNFPKVVIENFLMRAGIKATVLHDVVATRQGEKFATDDFIKIIEEKYKNAYPDVEFKIEQVRFPKDIYAVNKDDFQVKIDTGKFGANYAEIDNGIKKAQVYMYIQAFKKGYVAVDRIKVGDKISDKVRQELIDITNSRQTLLTDIDGLIATKIIAKGRALTEEQAQEMPALSKGETVKLIYDNGIIKIETIGIAEENAYVGRPVAIRNANSQKVITANYLGNGIAKAL